MFECARLLSVRVFGMELSLSVLGSDSPLYPEMEKSSAWVLPVEEEVSSPLVQHPGPFPFWLAVGSAVAISQQPGLP